MDTVERCTARAALAGNPSDGYGGAVLAMPIRQMRAMVTVSNAATLTFASADGTPSATFDGGDQLAAARLSPADAHALTIATVAEVVERWGPIPRVQVMVDSSIPRSVGLAGSSAIVIATLRAILRASDRPLPHPDLVAVIAQSIEVDRLGIAAGLQDRVVQAWDQPMAMSFRSTDIRHADGFAMGTYESVVIPNDAHLLVAWRSTTSAPSQVVHGELATRVHNGDTAVVAVMSALADEADAASQSIAAGDLGGLGRAMDRTFDLRAAVIDLDPAHVVMVEAARSVGAHCNYTGSGGSVIVLARDEHMRDAAERALRSVSAEVLRC